MKNHLHLLSALTKRRLKDPFHFLLLLFPNPVALRPVAHEVQTFDVPTGASQVVGGLHPWLHPPLRHHRARHTGLVLFLNVLN